MEMPEMYAKEAIRSVEQPPELDIEASDDDPQECALPTPRLRSRPKRPPTVDSETIDLTETPAPRRVQVSGGQAGETIVPEPSTTSTPPRPAEVIDLSDSPEISGGQAGETIVAELSTTSTPPRAAEVIDLSDSPEFVALESLPPPAPDPPANLPELPDVDILMDFDADADDPPASAQPSVSASPSLSELALPGPPTGSPTPEPMARFPSMDVDDVEQKPILLQIDDEEQKPILFQNTPVPDHPAPRPRPQGGSLVPTWLRDRYEASGQMALWKRYAEKQNRIKPLSRRKPETTTRSVGPPAFVVLPIVAVSQRTTAS
ncbi:hypothetical protein B0H17DRAFT_1190967 [Mycena rosella]|uniref:Uncharacterized protein n=1 Tax=Mycena rosella TaxID=1033263 RepID=A0AAD7H119_MYCRO|nr:hypothetical protein B0H17DRAFT_1190967 [Mycena rosella]